jgi:hypothetical protein
MSWIRAADILQTRESLVSGVEMELDKAATHFLKNQG